MIRSGTGILPVMLFFSAGQAAALPVFIFNGEKNKAEQQLRPTL
jgi:hypothetical protein